MHTIVSYLTFLTFPLFPLLSPHAHRLVALPRVYCFDIYLQSRACYSVYQFNTFAARTYLIPCPRGPVCT